MGLTVALAAAALAANLAASRAPRTPYPPPSRLAAEDAVLNASLAGLGMRRLAADVAFVRLLVYYGTPERGHEHEHGDGHDHGPEDFGGGVYAQLKDRALRILDLDPFFDYAALYAAGALAFNLGRPAEALEVLEAAQRAQPRNWRLAAYVAAIGFHRQGDARKVLAELLPVVQAPDAPTMLKNMVAFLLVREGRRQEAVRLYRDILASRDENYHPMARAALQRLGAAH